MGHVFNMIDSKESIKLIINLSKKCKNIRGFVGMSYQIIQLEKYFNAKKGKEETRDRLVKKVDTFEDIIFNFEEHISFMNPDDRVNLYFTPQECTDKKRDSVSQDNLFFDIDDVPHEAAIKTAEVICLTLGVNYNETLVIHSGNGLHVVIGLDHKLIVNATSSKDPNSDYRKYKPHYNALIDQINEVLRKNGLKGKADEQVFSRAHMVRYPNTHNIKKDKAPQVSELLQGNFKRVKFDLVERSGVKEKIEAPREDSMSNKLVDKLYPHPDTNAILEGCNFLKWGKEFPEQINEPMWFAGASIFRKMDNGEELFHEWSKGHPGYNKEEAQSKFYNVEGGPRLCETIDRMWGQCKTCPNFEKVKSPIAIKGESYLKTEQYGFFNWYIEEGQIVLTTPNYPELLKKFEMEFGDFKSAPESFAVYIFNGKYYEEMNKHKIMAWACDKLDKNKQRQTHRSEFLSFLLLHNSVSTFWFAESTMQKINMQNGVFDMVDMKLVPHSPDYGFKDIRTYSYDANAECPNFDKFLLEVTNDDVGSTTLLREFMGYALSGDKPWKQTALVLSGDGSNGKSTLLDCIRKLIGEKSCSSLMLKDLTKEEHRYQLDGALCNICEELPKSTAEGSVLKVLIGGGTIVVKKLWTQSYAIQNIAKMIFTCNELPQTGDSSYGIIRRFIIIPFDRVFSEELGNIDYYLDKKLEAELPGIFNEAINFYAAAKKSGMFTKSEKIVKAGKEFEMNQSSINEFAEEFLEFSDKYTASKKELYERYVNHCKTGNAKPHSRMNFFKNLKRKFPQVDWEKQLREDRGLKTVRVIRGVHVRSEYE